MKLESCKKPFGSLFAIVASVSAFGAAEEPVFFNTPCECAGNHGEYRWTAKTNQDTPPSSIPADHKLKPSDIGNWPGPGGKFHKDTARAGKETEWFEVTGRVKLVKAEADGDFHIQLVNADGGSDVNVVVEVPVGDRWCSIRQTVMSWGKHQPPFTATHGTSITLKKTPVVKVVGKAFYDAEHGSKDTTGNRRPGTKSQAVTVWEIHPVMTLQEVGN